MRALVLIGLGVAVVGCTKPATEVAVTPAPARVDAGASSPQPTKASLTLPLAPSLLSVFEPVDAGCEWRAVEPVKRAQVTLSAFPGTCVGARVAWSNDAGAAVVWFDPQHVQEAGYFAQTASKPGYPEEKVDAQATPRAFLVDVRVGTSATLPLPAAAPGHELQELGVGADGAPLALFEEALTDEVQKQGKVTVGAQSFDLTGITEGLPALAHAHRFASGRWTRVETALTTTGWDYAQGVRALDAFGRLGPRSTELASPHAQGDVVDGATLKALKRLSPKKAGAGDGEWIFLGAGGARLYVWEISGEFAYTTGLVAAGTPPKPLPQLGFTDGELVSIRTSQRYVLVTASDVGAHPRLYAMPDATLLYSSDTARGVTFWPTTAAPESHEAPK